MYVCAEYIWIGGEQEHSLEPNLRSKTRTILVNDSKPFLQLHELPIWNFDGSSTDQAETAHSEVELIPVYVCKDPLRGAPHVLVLCECVKPLKTPVKSNKRYHAARIFTTELLQQYQPWFGLEQEYVLLNAGPMLSSFQTEGSLHYCGVGKRNALGRAVAEEHLQACLKAGLIISGMNAEVMQNQWEFQIGPVVGIAAADQLWVARYILLRIAEQHRFDVLFHPKRFPRLSGSGCHANFSTYNMRKVPGDAVMGFITALERDHMYLMTQTQLYGKGNELRLTGEFETAPLTRFSYGIGDRTASIRIPTRYTGHIEDRRPAANADPYDVTAYLFELYVRSDTVGSEDADARSTVSTAALSESFDTLQ